MSHFWRKECLLLNAVQLGLKPAQFVSLRNHGEGQPPYESSR